MGNAIVPLSSLAIAPILAIGLGVEGRGEVAAAIAPLVLAISIATIGLPEALTYAVARMPSVVRAAARWGTAGVALSGIASTGAIVMTAPFLSGHRSELTLLIQISSLALIPALMLSLVRGIVGGHQNWHRISLEKMIAGVARVLGIGLLALNGALTPLSASICLACTYFIGLTAYIAYKPPPTEDNTQNKFSVREFYAYGSTVWFGSLSGIILARIDQTLMTPMSSVRELGYYAVAVNVSEAILIFNAAVKEVMFSVESANNDVKRLTLASRLSTAVTLVFAVCAALLTPTLLPRIFGEDFAPAVPVVMILLVAIVAGNPGSVAGAGLSARGRPGLRSLSLAIACCVNIGILVLLLPTLGAVGAAIATIVGNIVSCNLNLLWLRKYFSVPISEFYIPQKSDFKAFTQGLRRSKTTATASKKKH